MNILSLDLDKSLDEAGFRHLATAVDLRLGAHRIGAGVYQADEGMPIWPYDYHHGIEEQTAVNVLTHAAEEADPLGALLGAERLDGRVVDLEPGEGSEPGQCLLSGHRAPADPERAGGMKL